MIRILRNAYYICILYIFVRLLYSPEKKLCISFSEYSEATYIAVMYYLLIHRGILSHTEKNVIRICML